MADSYECDKCGEEFDSKRGLHIHEGQVHGDEEVESSEVENNDSADEQVSEEDVSSKFPVDQRTLQIPTELALFSVFVLGVAVGLSTGILAAGSGFNPGQVGDMMPGAEDGDTGNSDGPTVDVSKINTTGEPVLGQSDAPVTMVVYEDFQCPYCKRFEEGAVQQVESNYVVDGEVKIVWKDFPLQRIHPWAAPAAQTMECVYRQNNNAFWSVKDSIFQNQQSLNTDNVQSQIIEWAADEGIPENDVRSCLENGNPGQEVQRDLQDGQSFNTVIQTPQGPSPFVSSTPSSVIYGEGDPTGKPVVGAQPYGAVRSIIESKLGN